MASTFYANIGFYVSLGGWRQVLFGGLRHVLVLFLLIQFGYGGRIHLSSRQSCLALLD